MPQNTNRSSNQARYFIQKTYNTRGCKTIKISNNILNMNANGGLTGNELTSQMKSIKFGSNFRAISTSCFVNCAQLLSANLNTNCLEIGDAAFKNCSNLKYVNCLKPSTTTIVTQIGNEAFRNTGFKSINVQLSNGGSYGATCGSYAFADCPNLSAVSLERNPYIGDYMFANCRKLTNFSMANSHSYVGRNAFENCVSLTEITFPQNFYWLTTEMFKGCTNLSKVTFEEASQLKSIDRDVFSGCDSLTSITLPSSVDSLDYINPNFLRGSSIRKIIFNGLNNADIATEYDTPSEHTQTYETTCMISSANEVKDVIQKCQDENIPLICITTNTTKVISRGGSSIKWGCSICEDFHNDFLSKTEFQNWLTSNTKYLVVYGDACYGTGRQSAYRLIHNLGEDNIKSFGTRSQSLFWYWKKSNGEVVTCGKSGNGKRMTMDIFNEHTNTTFAGYEATSTEITTETSVSFNSKATTFGSDLSSITLVSKTGKEFICTQVNESTYEPETRIDYDTTNDFKFGIWYYNAQQLKAYADEHHIPVFLEFSSATCEPCKDFRENTFNKKEFQDAIKTKKCLLCRVELKANERWTTPNTQPYFCVNSWGDPNISIPQTVYYWKKADGTTTKHVYWYNYRTDPTNSTYQTILSRIDNLTASYTPGTDINLESPVITTITDKTTFKYPNQSNDTNGKYYICYNKTRQDSITVSEGITIDDRTETILTTGSATTFAQGYTYMMYTTNTNMMYDKEGFIFKVNSEGKIEYIYSFNNAEEDTENQGGSSTSYNVGTIYEMTQDTPEADLTAILDQAMFDQTQINIFKLDSSEESNRIKRVIQGTEFRNYASAKNMLFLTVTDTTGSWSQNAPQYLRQFQTTAQSNQEESTKVFEPTTVHVVVPCLMVYEACSQCTVDGSIVEYKKANYSLVDMGINYIKQCING